MAPVTFDSLVAQTKRAITNNYDEFNITSVVQAQGIMCADIGLSRVDVWWYICIVCPCMF